MHVVVTGAGGYSGSYLTSRLVAAGHRVTAYAGRSIGRLAELARNQDRQAGLRVVLGDLCSRIELPAGVEVIFHAAARSPAAGVTVDELVGDNVLATRCLLDAARKARVSKFIYFSSLSIYGDVAVASVDEATPIVNPDTYGVTKHLGERMLAAAPFPSLALRLPGIIGPRPVRNWLADVLARAKAGQEIAYHSPAAPFNNAVLIDDLCDLCLRLLEVGWRDFDSVTLGAAGQTAVGHVVETIVAAMGGRSALRVVEAPRPSFTISSRRAIDRYGYRPMDMGQMLLKFVRENV